MRTSSLGLGLAVLSAATFGTSGTFATSLLVTGWSPAAAVAIRVGVAGAVLTAPALWQLRGRWHLLRRNALAILVYGLLAVAGCQLFFFNAVEHLSVGVALLLEYSGTLLVVLWMWLRHAQRPNRLTVAGGVLAVLGLVLVLDLTGAQHISLVGVLWGLAAATGLAVYFVVSARSDEQLPPIVMAWGGMVIATVTLVAVGELHGVPFHASTRDADFHGHHTSWIVPVLGLALVAAVIAYSSGIGAARLLGARLASFVGLAEVVSAIVFAWLLLAERPTALQGVGGAIVLAGIALVRAAEPDLPVEPEPVPALG